MRRVLVPVLLLVALGVLALGVLLWRQGPLIRAVGIALRPAAANLWGRSCDSGECSAFQAVIAEGGTVEVLRVTVARRRMTIAVPLGILVPAGLTLRIDNGPEFNAGYETCLPAGCRAVLAMDQGGYDTLTTGRLAMVRYVTMDRRTVDVPVRLEGLAEALSGS